MISSKIYQHKMLKVLIGHYRTQQKQLHQSNNWLHQSNNTKHQRLFPTIISFLTQYSLLPNLNNNNQSNFKMISYINEFLCKYQNRFFVQQSFQNRNFTPIQKPKTVNSTHKQPQMQQQTSTQSIKVKAFKVILVGAQSVGKSSILNRLSDGRFSANYTPTIGIDFKTYSMDIGHRSYSLQIWDTAGQQKFRALTSSYYKGAHGCVCVFDLSDLQTLQKCDYYIEKAIEENIPKQCIYLVGNKSDLGEAFDKEGKQFAQKYEINYGVGSAKNGEGLTSLFNNLGSKMVGNFGGEVKKDGMELKPKLLITQRQNCKC